MKKTLLVTLDFYPKVGGVANYYFNLCKNLDQEKIVVLTDGEASKDLGFKVYRRRLLWKFVWPRWLPIFYHIWQIVRREKIEMIWVGEVLPTGTVVYALSKILKLAYIVSCHGNDLLQARKIRRKERLAEKILQRAKWVVANSQYTKELELEMGVREDKLKVIYPGINKDGRKQQAKPELARKYGLGGKRILLSLGRLVERKGFDKVIQSLPKVWQEISDLVYIVAGDGPDTERLKGLAKDDRINFLGKVSDEDRWQLMELCDVFIMPARQIKDDIEGFGIVYLEAGSHAKPVIAGNIGGAKEAVIDGQTGLLVEPENINEISRTIVKLFKDKELAKKLGQAGRQRAEEDFEWRKIVTGLEKLLN